MSEYYSMNSYSYGWGSTIIMKMIYEEEYQPKYHYISFHWQNWREAIVNDGRRSTPSSITLNKTAALKNGKLSEKRLSLSLE